MKEKTSLSEIVGQAFRKYNATLFTVLIVGGLSYCILVLASISQRPLDSSLYVNNANTGVVFNTVVVNQITNLKTNGANPGNQPLPAGRINPFGE